MNVSLELTTKAQVKDVFLLYPTLNSYGFGVYARMGKSSKEIKDEIKRGQDELLESLHQVDHVVNLVSAIPKIGTWNHRHTSYGLKHAAERTEPKHRYLYNGAFIVGAVIAGFRVKQLDMSPNCLFNMSEKGIKEFLNGHQ